MPNKIREVSYADYTNYRFRENREWRNILYTSNGGSQIYIWRLPTTFMELTEQLTNRGIQFMRPEAPHAK